MSHSHTHAPGQPAHSHSHSPQPGVPGAGAPAPGQQQQPQQQLPQLDPKMQALIEADFRPVALKIGDVVASSPSPSPSPSPGTPNATNTTPPAGSGAGGANAQAYCSSHGLEKCEACDVDFTALNMLARVFVQHPTLVCPPPPTIVQPQRSQAVNKTKEDGNVRCFFGFIGLFINQSIYLFILKIGFSSPLLSSRRRIDTLQSE